MKLTRERKIIGAVLLIALAALGYDQLFASSAGDAEFASDEAGTLLLASATSSNKPSTLSTIESDGASLASRLSAIAKKSGTTSVDEIRDVFRPADGWITKSIGDIPSFAAADKFVADHKLSTVSLNGTGGSVALVDGKLLHIGAKIDGFKLVAITHNGAMFESSDGARVQLKLTTETLATGR